jgi:DNA-directed RNA polymerase subunit L
MHGVDVLIEGHEHTLGNLLQTLLTEMYLETTTDSPITFAAYKVRHPLHRSVAIRLGMQENKSDHNLIARQVIAAAAQRAKTIFEDLAAAWENQVKA